MRSAFAALVLLCAGCATTPETADSEVLSDEQEAEVGREGDREIVAQFGVMEEPALQRYVDELGQELARVSHRPGLRYTFRILDAPVLNAFALPGGYVYVTRGLLPYLQGEGALAFVLGHQLAHVGARHDAERLTRQQLLGVGIGVAALLGDRFGLVTGFASAGAKRLLHRYEVVHERAADERGATYAARAGYDATAGADLFATLAVLSPERGSLPSWPSTHPDPRDRRDDLRALTRKAQAERGGSFTSDRLGYLRRLEGLVFGEDPRQGFVQDGWVNHPQLRFRVPVPGGWAVHTMASQMQLVSPEGGRAVILSLAAGDDPAAAAAAFSEHDDVDSETPVELKLQGFRAIRVTSTIATPEGEVAVVSTFIARDGRVFVFHGVCEPDDLPLAERVLTGIPDGFSPLTDARALAIEPAVIHVVEAGRRATFRELVAEWPLPEGVALDLAGLALLNGVAPEATVPQGTPLLVLRRR